MKWSGPRGAAPYKSGPRAGPRMEPGACFRADSGADFAEIEAEVARRLRASAERCAFLRSAPYLRFRMLALYRDRGRKASVYTPCGIRIEYAPAPGPAGGARVTVCSREDPEIAAAAAAEEVPNRSFQSSYRGQPSYRVYAPVRRPGRPRKGE